LDLERYKLEKLCPGWVCFGAGKILYKFESLNLERYKLEKLCPGWVYLEAGKIYPSCNSL
jgi:hypothetical protein